MGQALPNPRPDACQKRQQMAMMIAAAMTLCGSVADAARFSMISGSAARISRERGGDNEDHSHDVEDQEPVAEAVRRRAVGLVPIA